MVVYFGNPFMRCNRSDSQQWQLDDALQSKRFTRPRYAIRSDFGPKYRNQDIAIKNASKKPRRRRPGTPSRYATAQKYSPKMVAIFPKETAPLKSAPLVSSSYSGNARHLLK
jgi:hypothetical protein